MKLLVDINVVLDLVQRRAGFLQPAADLFAAVENNRASAFVAGHTITTVFYVVRRTEGTPAAAAIVGDLLRVVEVIPVERDDLLRALALGWGDFEDAVQAICAGKIGAEAIVTRDRSDFRGSPVPAMLPNDVLARLPG